jgi:hypothetical protein
VIGDHKKVSENAKKVLTIPTRCCIIDNVRRAQEKSPRQKEEVTP